MTSRDNIGKSELEAAVRQAGAALLELWPGTRGGTADALSVSSKADGSLVSEADYRSNEILIGALKRLFASDAILSEEVEPDREMLARAERVWVVDPLDGTSAFLSGRDDFSVLVGLCQRKQPTIGYMYFPARNLFVCAQQGQGAYVNGMPVQVSSEAELRAGRVYIRNFECTRPEVASPMMDSGLALMKVACGELDGAIIRMTTHREWDIAAPIAALLEAGGTVTDENGSPIECGIDDIHFQYFVASNTRLHAALIGILPR